MKQTNAILLDHLLKKTHVLSFSELDRIIGFYKTILELERSKEPDIDTYYPYAIHFKDNNSDVMLIDLPCNADFTKAFLDNRDLAFPKDLYVGLPIIFKDKPGQTIVFSLTIEYSDLNGYNPYESLLPVRISNLSLDMRHIDELVLPEGKIEDIEREISLVKNIHDLQELVRRHLGEDVEIKMELQLALSSKNIALAQISAELNRLRSSMVEKNELLRDFLTHNKFNNLIRNVSVDELIRVSALDDCQAKVVAHALSNKFSVVTGAPGTGKTQVILNIIANALLRDRTVLVASKNNKAVDNVKERFDSVDSSQYLLRFGKKAHVKTQTILDIDRIINRIKGIENHPDTLSTLLSQHETATSNIKDAKAKLSRIEEIKGAIPQLLADKSEIESQIADEDKRFADNNEAIKTSYSNVSHLDNTPTDSIGDILSQLSLLRNYLQRKYSGISGTWNNLFHRKKHAEIYLGHVEGLPASIKAELRDRNLTCSIADLKNGNAIIENSTQVISLLERIYDWQRALDIENKRHSTTLSSLNHRLDKINNNYYTLATELENLTKIKSELIYSIRKSKATLLNLGPQLVAAKIIEIEKKPYAAQKISSYKSYIPDNIPWKEDDLTVFISRTKDFLSVCRLISVTSLSVKTGFPLTDNLFDLLIIDEASQCDVASALPLILRAKQVIIIGDPMQLKHITSVREDEEKIIREHFGLSGRPYLQYVRPSLWDYAKDFLSHANQNNTTITLDNHYRCHHDIIGYSNHQFYGQFLDKPLNVMTDESKMTLPQQGIIMINVRGKQESDNVNINRIEADRSISLAKEIFSLKANVSIGIVTPFRDQADFIKSRLDDSLKLNVEVNTANGFQGDEKDVIIYSTVVTDNSPKRKIYWIDSMVPNLVNVAVTRARQTLYIVGNAEYIRAMSSEHKALGYLIHCAQSKNK